MAVNRRSVRAKGPTNYTVESSEDDDDDDPNTKEAKMKLKEMMRDDSDAESDFEQELLKEEAVSAAKEPEDDESSGEELDLKDSSFLGKRSHSNQVLNLSESESSGEENTPPPSKAKKNQKNPSLRSSYFSNAAVEMVVSEDADASQRLVALAGNLEATKNVWKDKGGDLKDAQKTSGNLESSFDLEISTLLAQGEGDSVDDVEEEQAEIKAESGMANGVEVTIAMPDNQRRKKQKKGFDVAAFIKREVNKSRRELQLMLHKVHYTCLLAHLVHLDKLLSNQLLQATGLSMVPLAHSGTPPDKMSLIGIGALVSWLRSAVPVNKHLDGSSPSMKLSSSSLLRSMQTMLAMNYIDLVLIFILICRSLGLATRIVHNLPILPLKPKSDGGMAVLETTKDLQPKPKHNKSEEKKQGNSSKESLSSRLSKAANLESAIKSSSTSSKKSSTSRRDKSDEKNLSKGKESRSKYSNGNGRKRSPVRRPSGSDDEGDDVVDAEKIKEKSGSKTEKRSLSSKLAEAAKARLSPSASTSSGKGRSGEASHKEKKSKREREEREGRLKSSGKSDTKDSEAKSRDGYSNIHKSKEREGPPSASKSHKSKIRSDVRDYWAEVFLPKEKRWVAVDLLTGSVNHPEEIESKCSKPVIYCLVAYQGKIKDVTTRYSSKYHVEARKLRTDQAWLEDSLRPFKGGDGECEVKEKEEMAKRKEEAPLPTSISQFKGHPLYVLQRHLLKFEAIYPVDAPTLGFIKGEPVYARECVKILQGRTAWLKEGRTVKLGESPYKNVKARPKWNRTTGSKVDDEALELFGAWQTELFVPPPAVDGKVPRNEYGNVELFKPWMLPPGTVHIPINGMKAVIRKCGIDAAPAMVGWDFSGGGAHPVYDGVVVCQENAEALMDAWNQEQEIQAKRAEEKREKRVLDNWKKLVKGLIIKQRIKSKYMKE